MGMDVFGKNPTNEEGVYFRNNVWWWRPLADYVMHVAPEIAGKCQEWGSNSGDGLEGPDSILLAEALQKEIDSGRTAEYEAEYDARIKALPRKRCDICGGTGVRSDEVGHNQGMSRRIIAEAGHPRDGKMGWCNGCNGIGTTESWDASYPFAVDNVQQFVVFLRSCGGFEIC